MNTLARLCRSTLKALAHARRDAINFRNQCPQQHPSEIFTQAFTEVHKAAFSLQRLARNSINAITSSMKAADAARVAAETSRVEEKLVGAVCKVKEIEKFSFACADRNRSECYAIGEWIHANFRVWQCENESGFRCVQCRLNDLECKVKERTETAIEVVRTCKGCLTPDDLKKCTETSAREAKSILEAAEKYVKEEIARAEKLKTEILRENDRIVEDLMIVFEKEVKQFVEQLDIYIRELREIQKRG